MEYIFKYSLSLTEKDEIINFISKINNTSIIQNPYWSDIVERNKKKCFFIGKKNENIEVFSIITEKLGNATVQFGPITNDLNILKESLIKIKRYYNKKIFGQLNILLPYNFINFKDEISDFKSEINFYTKEDEFNWSSLVLDLNQDIEFIYSSFSENHKRSIKKAIKNYISAHVISTETDIMKFAEIYDKMYDQRKIIKPFSDSKTVFKNIFYFFKSNHNGVFIGVYDNNNSLIGGLCLVNQGDFLFYQYGASDNDINLPILHVAFYEAIKYAKNNNFKYFDFGGYNKFVDQNSQIYHINRFKKGFGGYLIDYNESLYFALNIYMKIVYLIAKKLYHLLRKYKIFINTNK